jgi:hypothetical protein
VSTFIEKDALNAKFFEDFEGLATLSAEEIAVLVERLGSGHSIEAHSNIGSSRSNLVPEYLRSELPGLVSVVEFLCRFAEYARPEDTTRESIERAAEGLFTDQRHREAFQTLLALIPKSTVPDSPVDDADGAEFEIMEQRDYFDSHLDELLPSYAGRYVGLHQGKIVASGTDPELVHRDSHAAVNGAGPDAAAKSAAILVRKCEAPRRHVSSIETIPGALRGMSG